LILCRFSAKFRKNKSFKKEVGHMKTKYAILAIWLFLIGPVLICPAQEITLESLLPPLPDTNSTINAEYLLATLGQRPDVKTFFSDTAAARQSMLRWLKTLPHTDYELPCRLSAKPESILSFSLPQLVRVYLFLDGLENNDLTKQIGKIIASYEKGSQYEPGGIGLMKKGQVLAEQIASDSFVKPDDIIAGYELPKKDFARPRIFTFHFHPRLLHIFFLSPSWTAKFADGMEANVNYDIGEALFRAAFDGDSHQLLISELPNRTFNLSYYAAEKVEPPASPDPFGFCHRLTGFKIVNLGIWRY
jgi:hypothetical protein